MMSDESTLEAVIWFPLLVNLMWAGCLLLYLFIVVVILVGVPVLAVDLPIASAMTATLGDSNFTPPQNTLFTKGVYALNDFVWWLLYVYSDSVNESWKFVGLGLDKDETTEYLYPE